MKKIIVLGAGRSAGELITYLLQYAENKDIEIWVADTNVAAAEQKINAHPKGMALALNVNDAAARNILIRQATIVVSLLPADLHYLVAEECLHEKKHLITASYISEGIERLHEAVQKNGLIFMNEIGLDPGIDHISAMKIIAEIKNKGGLITSFKSWCGGLVAPESDTNAWHYKISWNPRNVVLAGKATAQYRADKVNKFIPSHRIFNEIWQIELAEYGSFEGYANRDSLSYLPLYGLEDCATLLRGTLRYQGYCNAWAALALLGYTDDSYQIKNTKGMSLSQLTLSLLPYSTGDATAQFISFLQINNILSAKEQLLSLGLLSDEIIEFEYASPAEILQHIITQKWKMQPEDRDLVVMKHEFEYSLENKKYALNASLYLKGDDAEHTAMSKTVGLPAAIYCTMILENKINQRGVLRPLHSECFSILTDLEKLGISFIETTKQI